MPNTLLTPEDTQYDLEYDLISVSIAEVDTRSLLNAGGRLQLFRIISWNLV